MGTLRMYELPREVPKLIGVLGASSPPNFTASQVGTRTLFGSFFGNNGLISLEKNFRAKFANDVIFNA